MRVLYVIFLCLVVIAAKNSPLISEDDKESRYIIRLSHASGECMKAINEIRIKGENYVSKFDFGCLYGDHTFYSVEEGVSEDAVRNSLPAVFQTNAKILKVDKLTLPEIEKIYQRQTDFTYKIK